jgi:hypothetical protein
VGDGRAEAVRRLAVNRQARLVQTECLRKYSKERGLKMRNILMTVMMLIVTALLFTSIINDGDSGMRRNIYDKGVQANSDIVGLRAGP